MDHRKAVIFSITHNGEERKRITSNVEKQPHSSGDLPVKNPCGAKQIPADDCHETCLNESLNSYYDDVIACIHDAESILILGPDEAKDELKKRIEKAKLGERIAGVETVDKITVPQVAAKVRQYYQEKDLRQAEHGRI